jgi:hypothetical protein
VFKADTIRGGQVQEVILAFSGGGGIISGYFVIDEPIKVLEYYLT